MSFSKESDFEEAFIKLLSQKGWEPVVLKRPTEADLLKNWAQILFENNRSIDRLNDFPLTDGEMQQILEQIATLKTPLKLNGFINGKTVSVRRDNSDDTLHFGKEVSLKIYDRHEIAAGQSRYQIAQQPQFKGKSKMLGDRRGDLMLLINGMPVFHVELKRSGVSVSQACNQIEKYAHEGVFSGIFSLIQVFVAMEPEETLYFANPGPDGKFNKDFYFHWADFNNEPLNHWEDIADRLLSIPMAHQLIGFYTVADDADGVLKVMRSYQYFAVSRISDRVARMTWDGHGNLGGHVWHTTGSGKTMTSFKSAQLIANSKDADKVVFLIDRIELGTQSLREYRAFSEENESVQETDDTVSLVSYLKSDNPKDTLIVTSIQKMSNISNESGYMKAADIGQINAKRIVIIVDECHRSVFGEMLATIKQTFSSAVFFGFTGTPIQEENQKKMNTTSTVFGDELHRYSIADGIRDRNVLGFDPYMVMTYRDKDLRHAVALEKARASSLEEVMADPEKQKIYYEFMDPSKVKMAGYMGHDGKYVNGIEDYLPKSQYKRDGHRELVVSDILDNWIRLSHNGKFHAIFATNSIVEAIQYYRLFKERKSGLKLTALFDPTIDNNGNAALVKEDGIVEILEDYNKLYDKAFTISSFAGFKKDVSARLAHKEPYKKIDLEPDGKIDLLIVVDQMLTGFDSKWINTLYLDKLMEYESIIQAFSRTNRLFGPEKPFGTIRYYRSPHSMARNIEEAVKLYSGDKPLGLFADKLEFNLQKMNSVYAEIFHLFKNAGVPDFEKLPDNKAERAVFARLFKDLNAHLEAAKIQGFVWEKSVYEFQKDGSDEYSTVKMDFNENTYLVLALRYKELFSTGNGAGGAGDVPYEIDTYLTEIDTGVINADYMNSRFDKYLKSLWQEGVSKSELQATLDDLYKSFAMLTQEEQKYANIFLHDVQSGSVTLDKNKTFRDYVTEYISNANNDRIRRFSSLLGLDENKLREMMKAGITEKNINEFGRFDDLIASVDKTNARSYFESKEGRKLNVFDINKRIYSFVQKFILEGGFDVGLSKGE